jgi:hypothetical protein
LVAPFSLLEEILAREESSIAASSPESGVRTGFAFSASTESISEDDFGVRVKRRKAPRQHSAARRAGTMRRFMMSGIEGQKGRIAYPK